MKIVALLAALAGALLVAGYFVRPFQLTLRMLGANLSLSTNSLITLATGIALLILALSVLLRGHAR